MEKKKDQNIKFVPADSKAYNIKRTIDKDFESLKKTYSVWEKIWAFLMALGVVLLAMSIMYLFILVAHVLSKIN